MEHRRSTPPRLVDPSGRPFKGPSTIKVERGDDGGLLVEKAPKDLLVPQVLRDPLDPRSALSLAGRDRNRPCSCGSGRKAKRCCGEPARNVRGWCPACEAWRHVPMREEHPRCIACNMALKPRK